MPESEIDTRIAAPDNGVSLLRFMTCGSVDDGKSTLIGRLLFDSGLLLTDQLNTLKADSRIYRPDGNELDYSLLLDGLQAEREQGITIDVSHRYFATDKRSFIVADTPGHEQYTRNMATGASTSDLAVILVDALKGVLPQTRRHSYIASLFGIRHFVLAVNKMDLVGYSQQRFEEIAHSFRQFTSLLGIPSVVAIPTCARLGENVTAPAKSTPWYRGPALLSHLESVDVTSTHDELPFRMPVQLAQRPNQDFRGSAGTIVSGKLKVNDRVVVAPGGRSSQVKRIVGLSGDLDEARSGQAVTLVLSDDIDVGRGDIIAAERAPPTSADQFAAHIVWMDEAPLFPGRQYLFQIGTRRALGQVTEIRYQIDVNTLEHRATKTLSLNDIGYCNVALDQTVAFDAFEADPATGAFIVIDRYSNATAGAGVVKFGLHRAENLSWQKLSIQKSDRASLKGQTPCVLWFTGLSGAGKSTIANLVETRLHALGLHTYLLDGDNIRHGLNRDLGFTTEDRVENVRRVAETAKLLVDAGLIVLVSLISPFRSERQFARDLLEPGEMIEIFVETPLEICASRDPKGLYRKAREGTLKNLTGVDSPYEAPLSPDIHLRGTDSADMLASQVMAELRKRRIAR